MNIKSLILNPQKITNDYILGKGILNPVSFLIISITIYLIVLNFFNIKTELGKGTEFVKDSTNNSGYATGVFLRTYLKYFWIFSIIPLGLMTKLIFTKKYSYLENVAISSFIIGQATLVGLISFLFLRLPMVADPVVYFVILTLIYRIFKEDNTKIKSLLLALIAVILFILIIFLIIITVGYGLGDFTNT